MEGKPMKPSKEAQLKWVGCPTCDPTIAALRAELQAARDEVAGWERIYDADLAEQKERIQDLKHQLAAANERLAAKDARIAALEEANCNECHSERIAELENAVKNQAGDNLSGESSETPSLHPTNR